MPRRYRSRQPKEAELENMCGKPDSAGSNGMCVENRAQGQIMDHLREEWKSSVKREIETLFVDRPGEGRRTLQAEWRAAPGSLGLAREFKKFKTTFEEYGILFDIRSGICVLCKEIPEYCQMIFRMFSHDIQKSNEFAKAPGDSSNFTIYFGIHRIDRISILKLFKIFILFV
jgi:hypothetical protein